MCTSINADVNMHFFSMSVQIRDRYSSTGGERITASPYNLVYIEFG